MEGAIELRDGTLWVNAERFMSDDRLPLLPTGATVSFVDGGAAEIRLPAVQTVLDLVLSEDGAREKRKLPKGLTLRLSAAAHLALQARRIRLPEARQYVVTTLVTDAEHGMPLGWPGPRDITQLERRALARATRAILSDEAVAGVPPGALTVLDAYLRVLARYIGGSAGEATDRAGDAASGESSAERAERLARALLALNVDWTRPPEVLAAPEFGLPDEFAEALLAASTETVPENLRNSRRGELLQWRASLHREQAWIKPLVAPIEEAHPWTRYAAMPAALVDQLLGLLNYARFDTQGMAFGVPSLGESAKRFRSTLEAVPPSFLAAAVRETRRIQEVRGDAYDAFMTLLSLAESDQLVVRDTHQVDGRGRLLRAPGLALKVEPEDLDLGSAARAYRVEATAWIPGLEPRLQLDEFFIHLAIDARAAASAASAAGTRGLTGSSLACWWTGLQMRLPGDRLGAVLPIPNWWDASTWWDWLREWDIMLDTAKGFPEYQRRLEYLVLELLRFVVTREGAAGHDQSLSGVLTLAAAFATSESGLGETRLRKAWSQMVPAIAAPEAGTSPEMAEQILQVLQRRWIAPAIAAERKAYAGLEARRNNVYKQRIACDRCRNRLHAATLSARRAFDGRGHKSLPAASTDPLAAQYRLPVQQLQQDLIPQLETLESFCRTLKSEYRLTALSSSLTRSWKALFQESRLARLEASGATRAEATSLLRAYDAQQPPHPWYDVAGRFESEVQIEEDEFARELGLAEEELKESRAALRDAETLLGDEAVAKGGEPAESTENEPDELNEPGDATPDGAEALASADSVTNDGELAGSPEDDPSAPEPTNDSSTSNSTTPGDSKS